jgi:hypothetical protein
MQQIETTPWYPTARLFRQRTPGDWNGVLERVIEQLTKLRSAQSRQTIIARKPEAQSSQLIPA